MAERDGEVDEWECQAVVEAGLGGQSEPHLVLPTRLWRPDLNIGCQHRIGAYLGGDGIFRGGGLALEMGHIPVRAAPHAAPQRIETYAFGVTLVALAAEHRVPVADLFTRVQESAALDDIVWHHAATIASASILFSPRIILIGGGVLDMQAYPRDVRSSRILECLPRPAGLQPPVIRQAVLGWKAAIHGAILLGTERASA